MYTDSRGTNIPGQENYNHYTERLANIYNVEKYLCPEKWTTTLDFFQFIKNKKLSDFDAIILHTGIVEHSPRHQQIARYKIYEEKKEIFNEVFGEKNILSYLNKDFGIDYEGDKTINLYSLEMGEREIIPRLKDINHLIWISGNPIVPNWNGNYWKERPQNISIIEDYSNLFLKELNAENTIDLMKWSEKQVKKYTFDNMHPTKIGSDYIFNEIQQKLKRFIYK